MLEQRLKQYRKLKADVTAARARIEQWQKAITDGRLKDFVVKDKHIELGMPKAPGFSTKGLDAEICEIEATEEFVKELISQDESRIFLKELELQQIDTAMEALTEEQKYIIKCKYFDNMNWIQIEYSFNTDYIKTHNRQPVAERQLKKIDKDAIEVMKELLEPFYKQWRIA